jgi:hypothetical protein
MYLNFPCLRMHIQRSAGSASAWEDLGPEKILTEKTLGFCILFKCLSRARQLINSPCELFSLYARTFH